MVLDFAGVTPNPARDKGVKLPREEPDEVQPPHADHVESVGWLLTPPYLIGLLALDSTGARVGEVAAAKVGDLDENRKAWLVRAMGRVARRPVRRRCRSSPRPRGSRRRRAAVPDWFSRPSTHGDCSRMPGRRGAGVQPPRSPTPPDQPAPPSRDELGRDRGACWATEPLDDSRHLHPRADGPSRDRPGETARACPYGALPRAHPGAGESCVCRYVLGLPGPNEIPKLSPESVARERTQVAETRERGMDLPRNGLNSSPSRCASTSLRRRPRSCNPLARFVPGTSAGGS